jgi:hypothetical protein
MQKKEIGEIPQSLENTGVADGCGYCGNGGKLFNTPVENPAFPFLAKPPAVVVFGLF